MQVHRASPRTLVQGRSSKVGGAPASTAAIWNGIALLIHPALGTACGLGPSGAAAVRIQSQRAGATPGSFASSQCLLAQLDPFYSRRAEPPGVLQSQKEKFVSADEGALFPRITPTQHASRGAFGVT